MRWVGHVARTGEINDTKFQSEELKGRDYYIDLGINVNAILKLFLKE
jgi:hypothetical protein